MPEHYYPETLSYSGASKVKDNLERAWRKQGLTYAKARIVCTAGIKDGRDIYIVRSNVTFTKLGYPIVIAKGRGRP
jgi:hypothetical protein